MSSSLTRAQLKRKARRRKLIVAGAGAVFLGGGAVAYAAMSGGGAAYRLATVSSGDVAQTLRVVGTLQPVHQADVSFPASGTVKTVSVSAGQTVKVGQALGALDPSSLQAALTSARSTLATAQATVSSDEASQTAAASSASASGLSSGNTSGLAHQQQQLLSAARHADNDLRAASSALRAAVKICAVPAPTSTPTPSESPTASPNPSDSPSPYASPDASAHEVQGTRPTGGSSEGAPTRAPTSCIGAQQAVLSAQTKVSADQEDLVKQISALDQAISKASNSSSMSSSSSSSSGNGRPSTLGRSDSGAARTVTAAQLIADQAAVDAAQADLDEAQQELDQAEVISPISGTVVSVAATKGAKISASTTAFTVSGLDSYQVTSAVAVANIAKVKVGDDVSVEADGTTGTLTAKVVSIGLVPTTSGTTTTYPVTIGFTGTIVGLHDGTSAVATITTKTASAVMIVPTSAVHTLAAISTVDVYERGKSVPTRVTLGAVGAITTEITSGLNAGQQIVLANLKDPIPSSNSTNIVNRLSGGGGLGGNLTGGGGVATTRRFTRGN